MFELTGALPFVLPIMIAVMLAKQIADGFGKRGIYETWIHLNGYPYLDKTEEYSRDLAVREIMTKIEDLIVITAIGSTIDSLSTQHPPSIPTNNIDTLLRTQPYKGFPVVTDTRNVILLGYISRSELRFALDQARKVRGLSGSSMCYFTPVQFPDDTGYVDLRPWMDSTPITLSHGSSMQVAVQLFEKLVRNPKTWLTTGSAICIIHVAWVFNGSYYKEGCHSEYGFFKGE
jgi:chloride channel 3/4/5